MSKNEDSVISGAIHKSESKIQQEIAMYYRNAFCLKHHSPRCMLFSIPNESNEHKAMTLTMTGLYPGCADIAVWHKWKHPFHDYETHTNFYIKMQFLFFEVKSPDNKSGPRKNGQSQKQIDFEDHCIAMGIPYHLVTSCDQFKAILGNL